ncbi:MAG: hypothetical protein KUG77_24155, partial [Nannocystaceae bacterium]|nr:hypothetical protein [Nannocystaceae bacterium]
MRRSASVFAALVLAASTLGGCDKDIPAMATPSGESPVDAAPKAAVEPTDILALGDAKLFEADKPSEAVEIAADGSVSFAGEVVATLSGEGKLTLPEGTVMMEVQADGSVLANGEPTGLALGDTGGTLQIGDQRATMVFHDDGTVTVDPAPGPGAPAMAHEGCTGAMAKTCALVMFGMVGSTDQSTAPESVEGDAGVEAPAV